MNKYCAHFMGSCFVPLTPLPLVYENSQLTMTNGRSSLASKVQRLFSFPDFALKVSALGCLWLGESYHLKGTQNREKLWRQQTWVQLQDWTSYMISVAPQ